jgi:glycogen synthase
VNIVYLTNQFPPNVWGGMGIYVNFLAEQIGNQNNRLWVYTTNSGRLPDYEERGPLVIHRPIRFWLRRLLRNRQSNGAYTLLQNLVKVVDLLFNNVDCFLLLRSNLKRDRYDLIVVHDSMHSLAGLLCRLFLDVPIVFHVHFVEYTMTRQGRKKDPLGVIRLLERVLAREAENVIVGTSEMRDLVVQHGWNEETIRIVPLCSVRCESDRLELPGPELTDRLQQMREQLNIESHEKVIVYAGRLVSLKGVFHLLQAMRLVADQVPVAKLVLVGEGNRGRLDRTVKSLDLGDRVHLYHRFLGYEDVLHHYLMADLCVFPSIQEPFGLAALEAMGVGTPVVLGTGFSRVFEGALESPNALYVDPFSPEDIAEKMVTLLTDEAAAAEMGRRARDFVRETFTAAKVVDLTLTTYSHAARPTRPGLVARP